jgi:hypothetical protein
MVTTSIIVAVASEMEVVGSRKKGRAEAERKVEQKQNLPNEQAHLSFLSGDHTLKHKP